MFEDSKIVSACARERHAAGTEFIIIKQICGVIAKQALLRWATYFLYYQMSSMVVEK